MARRIRRRATAKFGCSAQGRGLGIDEGWSPVPLDLWY